MKIGITTSSFAQYSEKPLDILRQAGLDHIINPYGRKLTEDESISFLKGCIGVAAGTEPLTVKVMDALPSLKVISRCGVGMDNVDIPAAQARGIKVCNTPKGPTLAVAELTLALTLNLLRKINKMDRELRSGVWVKRMGNNLKGKRLGIIGFGRIGQAVARAFGPLGVDVAYNDPLVSVPGYPKMSLNELLAWADIISFHCSKAGGECSSFQAEQLKQIRPGGWIINAARGGIIDETDLYEILKSGHLAGAAVDVFEQEPYEGPLKDLDNVILTPHIGSYAMESRIQMEIDTVVNLINELKR